MGYTAPFCMASALGNLLSGEVESSSDHLDPQFLNEIDSGEDGEFSVVTFTLVFGALWKKPMPHCSLAHQLGVGCPGLPSHLSQQAVSKPG